MYLPFHITLAADIGDFAWLIFIVIMVVGSIISSIFKAITETAEKNKRRQMREREATQGGGGEASGPRTASQRIQELAEQRRQQLEQMAAERRRQLQEMARQRQGGGTSTPTAAPPPATVSAPPLPSESAYDRQMRERQEAARRHQQELDQRRAAERAAAQRRQQELERRRAEAGRRPKKVAPPPPPPAPVRDTPYRKLEIAEQITDDMIVSDTAPGHGETVHRHVRDVAQPTLQRKRAVTVPRLDHPERLRQAFIIKEILDRPLSLREDDDPYR